MMNPHPKSFTLDSQLPLLNSQFSIRNFSLYIHIPFCLRLCPFCHFYRIPDIPDWRVYLEGIRKELDLPGFEDAGSVRTMYVGGGTPTVFPVVFFRELFQVLAERFDLSPLEESTIETDGDVTVEELGPLRDTGFDRISIGVKSFLPRTRELLGIEPWSGKDPVSAARKAGFPSVSVDLVYGIEGQTLDELVLDLKHVAVTDPDHVSLYSLEEGDGSEWDPDLASAMFRESLRALTVFGYQQYEITNFARASHPSRHNAAYWQDADYIGIGPSAHSSLTRNGVRTRWRNRPDVFQYLKNPSGCREILSREEGADRAREALILGLRMREGVHRAPFYRRYGHDPVVLFGTHLRELKEAGLVRLSAGRIRLTTRGMLLSNEVFVGLI